MKSPEQIAKELGFAYIDDIQPQIIRVPGNQKLLDFIDAIQKDARADFAPTATTSRSSTEPSRK